MAINTGTIIGADPPKPVVLLTEPIATAAMDTLAARTELRVARVTDAAALVHLLGDVEGLIVRSSLVTSEMIAAAPQLKVIGRHGAGTENIDIAAASSRGIPVVCTPGANADAVAEFVLLAALTLKRRLSETLTAFHAGSLGPGSLPGGISRAGLLGTDLAGSVVGLIGLGAIGRRVAEILVPHRTRVIYYDPFIKGDGSNMAEAVSFETLLSVSDLLSIHVPLTADTKNMLSHNEFGQLKPGALVINTARAEVVDSEAVLAALDHGQLGGYAVDVYSPEPPESTHPFLSHPKIFATPHMAAMTVTAMGRVADSVVADVLAVLEGETPRSVANRNSIELGEPRHARDG